MMCEDCGERLARFHLVTIINGSRVERDLCLTCMTKHQKQISSLDFSNLAGILNNLLDRHNGDDEAPSEEPVVDITCEQCGMTYAEFQKGGMLGCAKCYQAFRPQLIALLQRVHGNTQHAGKVPRGEHSGVSIRMNIERLRQKLQKAVEDEEYEQAARYRDAIRALTLQMERQESEIRVKPHERISAETGEEASSDA